MATKLCFLALLVIFSTVKVRSLLSVEVIIINQSKVVEFKRVDQSNCFNIIDPNRSEIVIQILF